MYFGFKNICISYGKRDILRNVSIEFPKGKVISIIGPNGCGKSSLLKVLSKGVIPKEGEAFYSGKCVKSYKPKELARKIAILPQIHESPADIDVKTLVSYGRYPYTSFSTKLTLNDWDIIHKAMESTGISALAEQKLGTLSGGEQQRAWIAMTICQQPEILVLDEPTTYLDINHQVEVLELVRTLNEQLGITIVMVLHDLNLATRYSDYLYAIKNGVIHNAGTPQSMITQEFLADVFSLKVNMYEDEINKCPYFIPQCSLRAN